MMTGKNRSPKKGARLDWR